MLFARFNQPFWFVASFRRSDRVRPVLHPACGRGAVVGHSWRGSGPVPGRPAFWPAEMPTVRSPGRDPRRRRDGRFRTRAEARQAVAQAASLCCPYQLLQNETDVWRPRLRSGT